LILFFIYLIWRKFDLKKIFQISLFFILCASISIGFVALVVKFPYPKPTGGFNTAELLSERASEIKGEAAVASRWALLPELWKKIKIAPILGKGFGAAVTYKSSDPRILEQNPRGEYTTYAFEWGWLDIWLKLGFLGLMAYLILIGKIVYDGLSKISNAECRMPNAELILGLIIGIAVISVVNIFTPYLNHPLGIGYLILVSAILNKKRGC
jgi:O-antigen ligase